MAKKADKITYEQRVNQVLALIHRGWDSTKIVQNVSAAWDVTERQGWGYVKTARNRIAKLYEHKRSEMAAEILSRHDDLRDKGYADADYKLVLDLDKEDAKLLGLYAPERQRNENLNLPDPSELTAEQRQRIIAGEDPLKVIYGDADAS